MKVALIVTGGLHPSGVDQVIPVLLSFIERLAARADVHAFVVRHLPTATRYRLRGATVHDLGRPDGRWRQWRALSRAMAAAGPFDLVHGYWADPAGVLATMAGRWFGLPSIVTCDSGEFTALPALDYGLQRTVTGRTAVFIACRGATRVHVASAYMEALARARGLSVVRFPLGVPVPDPPAPPPHDGPPWRLLQVASLNRVKDQTTLLEALALTRRTHDVCLDLAGQDTMGGHLQHRARDLHVAHAVTFHGFVRHDALRALHARAHLYVQSSRHEASGVAVLEAAAAGVPIVGSRTGFVSDWHPEAAAAVPAGDAVALSAAIVGLLEAPGERRRLAEAARRLVRRDDADAGAVRMIALYESILRQRSVSPMGG